MAFFYEEIHRAKNGTPYVDTEMTDVDYRAHYHEEVELIYIPEGTVEVTVENTCTLIHTGDIAIILPYRIHSLRNISCSRLYIFKLLCAAFDFSSLSLPEYFLSENKNEHACGVLRGFLMRLVNESKRPDSDALKELALKCAADEILLSIASIPGAGLSGQNHMNMRHKYASLLNTVNDYLQKHYREEIRLEDAAFACHFSSYYFAHCFKRAAGMTFNTYLTEFRLKKAAELIKSSSKTLTEIALACGFASVRTFNRSFMKFYNITPSQLRKNNI